MGIAKLHAKMTCIHANIIKNSDLNFVFMRNFVHKKIYLFRMNAQFRAKLVSYWYKNDAEFRAKKVISHKTTQLLRKRIDCFVETLLLFNNLNFIKGVNRRYFAINRVVFVIKINILLNWIYSTRDKNKSLKFRHINRGRHLKT